MAPRPTRNLRARLTASGRILTSETPGPVAVVDERDEQAERDRLKDQFMAAPNRTDLIGWSADRMLGGHYNVADARDRLIVDCWVQSFVATNSKLYLAYMSHLSLVDKRSNKLLLRYGPAQLEALLLQAIRDQQSSDAPFAAAAIEKEVFREHALRMTALAWAHSKGMVHWQTQRKLYNNRHDELNGLARKLSWRPGFLPVKSLRKQLDAVDYYTVIVANEMCFDAKLDPDHVIKQELGNTLKLWVQTLVTGKGSASGRGSLYDFAAALPAGKLKFVSVPVGEERVRVCLQQRSCHRPLPDLRAKEFLVAPDSNWKRVVAYSDELKEYASASNDAATERLYRQLDSRVAAFAGTLTKNRRDLDFDWCAHERARAPIVEQDAKFDAHAASHLLNED